MIAMHSCSETNEWVWIMGGRRTILEHSSKREFLYRILSSLSQLLFYCVCAYMGVGVWRIGVILISILKNCDGI